MNPILSRVLFSVGLRTVDRRLEDICSDLRTSLRHKHFSEICQFFDATTLRELIVVLRMVRLCSVVSYLESIEFSVHDPSSRCFEIWSAELENPEMYNGYTRISISCDISELIDKINADDDELAKLSKSFPDIRITAASNKKREKSAQMLGTIIAPYFLPKDCKLPKSADRFCGLLAYGAWADALGAARRVVRKRAGS